MWASTCVMCVCFFFFFLCARVPFGSTMNPRWFIVYPWYSSIVLALFLFGKGLNSIWNRHLIANSESMTSSLLLSPSFWFHAESVGRIARFQTNLRDRLNGSERSPSPFHSTTRLGISAHPTGGATSRQCVVLVPIHAIWQKKKEKKRENRTVWFFLISSLSFPFLYGKVFLLLLKLRKDRKAPTEQKKTGRLSAK